jgi:hypothetical protein
VLLLVLRAISKNINGLGESKVLLHDTYCFLSEYDIILLTETRSISWVDRALPGYSVAHIPASLDGKAGEGILVAVKRCHSYVVQDWGSNATCLWVKLAFAGSPPPHCGLMLHAPSWLTPAKGNSCWGTLS